MYSVFWVYLCIPTFGIMSLNCGKCRRIFHTWIGMEFKTRTRETETCVCLKRTQRKKLKRSTQTTYLSLVGGSDTTTHHIFRICPAPLAIDGCGISLLLLPFASRKTTLVKSMRKKNTKKYLIYKIIFCILRTALKHGALVFTSTHQLKERHRDLPMSLSRSPKNLPDNPPPAIRFKCSAKVKWNDARLGGLEFIFQLKLEDVYMFMRDLHAS